MAKNELTDKEEENIGAHAIIITNEDKILLQQKDDNPKQLNPGLISMFGGATNKEEAILDGLKRELLEELELDVSKLEVKKLGVFRKYKEVDGVDCAIHAFIITNINQDKLIVHEGSIFIGGNNSKLINNPKLTRITKLALEKYFEKQS